MEPRDVFDSVLLAILGVILYLHIIGPSFSATRVQTVIDVLLGLDLVIYLVAAALLAICFIGYLFVYLPQKQSKNPTR
jgi:Kef-type K+ transport system membrane component KefB